MASEPVAVPYTLSGGAAPVSEALTLSARQAQLLLEKLHIAEAALEEERQLSGQEREVLSERLRFAQSEDEAARERLGRALSSLRSRARDGAQEVAEQQLRSEEQMLRLQEECRELKASQQQSEQEAAALRHVQREQQAQLALVSAERERLSQEAQEWKVEAEKERKIKDEMSECVSHWRLRADAEGEEKDRVMNALATACKQHDEQVGKFNEELGALRGTARCSEVQQKNPVPWGSSPVRDVSRSKSPPSLQASPNASPAGPAGPAGRRPLMLELRCQELQSRLERALVQAEASRQRTLELELQLQCERGDSRAQEAPAGTSPPVAQPRPTELELHRKTAQMEVEMNAARAQAHAAKMAEESALEALSDSERRCRDGLRRMDAMLADTKELTRELAKHKYLAQGMDSVVRRHEARMLRSPESRRGSTSTPASRRTDFGRFTSPRMIREPLARIPTIPRVPGLDSGSGLATSFLSDPGTSRFGRSPSPLRRVEIEPVRQSPASQWRS